MKQIDTEADNDGDSVSSADERRASKIRPQPWVKSAHFTARLEHAVKCESCEDPEGAGSGDWGVQVLAHRQFK